jgi:hypothetical protein
MHTVGEIRTSAQAARLSGVAGELVPAELPYITTFARARPEGPGARVADDHALSSRNNGSNWCGAGQGPGGADNGADDETRRVRRITKMQLREVLRDCTVHVPFLDRIAGKLKDHPADGKRMGGCGMPGPGKGGHARVMMKAGIAYFSDIESCKSRLCPVCGPRIAGRRGRRFTQAVGRWHARGPDHDAWFIRLSAQNTADLPLADGVERVTKGFSRLTHLRAWRELRERYGMHYIKVREETHGGNGWNVHLHLVIATRADDPAQVLADLTITLRRLWPDAMARLGYYADPKHSVHIEQVRVGAAGEIGSYMAKEAAWDIGSELALGGAKLGRPGQRTYEQIVGDYGQAGDAGDLALIHEYHEAIYGRRHCSWSEGFRELLSLPVEEADEELAGEDEEPDGPSAPVDVAVIAGHVVYAMLLRCEVAGLLDSAERRRWAGVRDYVVKLGYPPGAVVPGRPDLTRRQAPRDGPGRYSRTSWGGDRQHVSLAEVHQVTGPVAGCVCETCRG